MPYKDGKPFPWETIYEPGIPFKTLSPGEQEAIRRRTEDVLAELRRAQPANEMARRLKPGESIKAWPDRPARG